MTFYMGPQPEVNPFTFYEYLQGLCEIHRDNHNAIARMVAGEITTDEYREMVAVFGRRSRELYHTSVDRNGLKETLAMLDELQLAVHGVDL